MEQIILKNLDDVTAEVQQTNPAKLMASTAAAQSLPAPNPSAILGLPGKSLQVEPDGAARTRARVLTDEGSYEGVFPGATAYTAVNGGMIIVGGTNVWSRANTITPLRVGDYVEMLADRLETAPKMVQVETINAGGLSGTLRGNYTGAGSAVLAAAEVSDFVIFCTGNLNDVVAVGASAINLQVGIVNGARSYIARQLGAGGPKGSAPVRLFFVGQIDHRRANQAIVCGVVDAPASYLAPLNQVGGWLFDNTLTAIVKTYAAARTTLGAANAYALPAGMDSALHPTGYEVCIYEDRVEWWVVDMNDNHYERIAQWGVWYPDPYQNLWLFFQIENTGVPAGPSSMISITQINAKSLDIVDVRAVQPDASKLNATVKDATPEGPSSATTTAVAVNVVVNIAATVAGDKYRVSVDGGAGFCLRVDGVDPVITDECWYDGMKLDFIATVTSASGVRAIKKTAATADGSVTVARRV
jgi:hypothetical protein